MPDFSIGDLPNEVIQQILYHLPPASVPALLQVSRRFHDLAHPLLWQFYCRTRFRYWNEGRKMEENFKGDVQKLDWKKVFEERYNIDRLVDRKIDSILSSQVGRMEKFQQVLSYGYAAKDALLRHLNTDGSAEDVLSRRFYSNALLGCLHRKKATMEWAQLMQGKDVSLERALAAFDIFVLHDREGDFDDISACLDLLAQRIRDAYPGLEQESPRQKAVIIAIYVRTHGFAGVNESSRYHDLRNNFLGIALFQEDHSSLSLISVVIYCCIATRLGLDAQPCCFPFHVLAIIKPSGGCDLDEKPLAEKVVPAPMYMDPYRTEQETPVADLKAQLLTMGALSSSHAMYLDASPVGDIVLRSARNIINSVQHAYSNAVTGQGHDGTGHLSLMHTFPDMESAFYSALWALLLLGMPPDGDGLPVQAGTRRQYLPYIIQHLESHFPMDVSLIEEHIEPLFEGSGERGQLRDTIRVMRAGDVMAKQLKPRSREVNQQVRFRVGQVFKHKRYSYQAVITGWDVECGAGEHWMAQMRIHELSRGKHQSFYHVLVEDKSVRYVAEENIEIIKPAVPFGLLPLAGRYFRRWDRDTCTFISNIKDEYPDD